MANYNVAIRRGADSCYRFGALIPYDSYCREGITLVRYWYSNDLTISHAVDDHDIRSG
jgi:hypothetical protein